MDGRAPHRLSENASVRPCKPLELTVNLEWSGPRPYTLDQTTTWSKAYAWVDARAAWTFRPGMQFEAGARNVDTDFYPHVTIVDEGGGVSLIEVDSNNGVTYIDLAIPAQTHAFVDWELSFERFFLLNGGTNGSGRVEAVGLPGMAFDAVTVAPQFIDYYDEFGNTGFPSFRLAALPLEQGGPRDLWIRENA